MEHVLGAERERVVAAILTDPLHRQEQDISDRFVIIRDLGHLVEDFCFLFQIAEISRKAASGRRMDVRSRDLKSQWEPPQPFCQPLGSGFIIRVGASEKKSHRVRLRQRPDLDPLCLADGAFVARCDQDIAHRLILRQKAFRKIGILLVRVIIAVVKDQQPVRMAVHIFRIASYDRLRRLLGGSDLFFCQKCLPALDDAVDGVRVDPVDQRIRAGVIVS